METHSTQPAVLVVEDEWLIRLHARTVVEDAGFCVVEASGADEALTALDANPNIMALFTDINMPGALDGLELAHEVHARRPDVRLIITSGRLRPSQDSIPDDGIFLAKPYSEEAVVQSLAGLLH
jgi:CheY-like chemotaxis protein